MRTIPDNFLVAGADEAIKPFFSMACDLLKTTYTVAGLIRASGEEDVDKDTEDQLLILAEESACEASRVLAALLQAIIAGVSLEKEVDPLGFINNYAAIAIPAAKAKDKLALPTATSITGFKSATKTHALGLTRSRKARGSRGSRASQRQEVSSDSEDEDDEEERRPPRSGKRHRGRVGFNLPHENKRQDLDNKRYNNGSRPRF